MLKLTALAIGHGDATLLQWFQDPGKPFPDGPLNGA